MDGLIEQRQFLFFQMLTGPYAMNAAQQRRFADWLFDSGHVWRCLGFQAGLCSLAGNDCFWLELGADGMAYSCNKGYAADRAFADWRQQSLAEVIEARRRLYAGRAVDPACQDCRAWGLCHAGCALERSAGRANDCALRLDEMGFTVAVSHDGPGQADRGPDPFDHPVAGPALMELIRRLQPLPATSRMRRHRQQAIDFIAEKVGFPPFSLRHLAFSSTYANQRSRAITRDHSCALLPWDNSETRDKPCCKHPILPSLQPTHQSARTLTS